MSFGPKNLAEAKKHIYGHFSKRPYDPARCAASVWEPGRAAICHQCERKPGHGPDGIFCKQHDPAEERRRAEKSNERFQKRMRAISAPWEKIEQLEAVIADLRAKLATAEAEIKRLHEDATDRSIERDLSL